MSLKEKSASAEKHDRLRVIIVGGSIAGLTLAHSLHHSNVDFVVLEAGKELAPQVGASIVVFPNGARILDQLGMFDQILASTESLTLGTNWTEDGKMLLQTDAPLLIEARTGYPGSFMSRQLLLDILSKNIHDKSKVHTSKRVCDVKQNDDGVVVTCEDGSSYTGDIVVGADGIHSTVRTFMQNHIDKKAPGKADKDRKSITAEYNCIFGIGGAVEGDLIPGETHRSYCNGYSTLSFVGHDDSLYWFLFSKLDKKYHGKDIPKYTKADVDEAIKPFFNIHLTDSIKFDKVWEKRTFANMTSVEESINENWTSDRFVCIGDSIHKVTPNAGAGGNAAIESAAALANSLATLKNTKKPSLVEIQTALRQFYEKRHERANVIIETANKLTRIEALETLKDKAIVYYALPYLADSLVNRNSNSTIGAELLDFLPEPKRSLEAMMPWNPNGGLGKEESRLLRALYAVPLLLITYACHRTMGATISALVVPSSAAGTVTLSPSVVVPLCTKFFGVEGLDKFISKFVAFFTPAIANSDPIGQLQALAFLGDLIPIQTIWMIEGIRRGNSGTVADLLPTILGVLFQIRGIGYIAPIYYFLHYVQSPLENYAAPDNRMMQMGPVKTIIPTILLSYILPSVAMFTAPSLTTRQWVNGLFWQPFPIYASILQRVLPRFVKDTTQTDRISRPEADMPYLRAAYGFAATAAACGYLYVRFKSPVSLMKIFFDGIANPTEALPLIMGATKALKYDQIAAFSAGAIWTLLSFADLKKAKKLEAGWGRVLGVFAGTTLTAGPGAAMAVMWAWREETLAKRRSRTVEKK
ncbi:FAD/NAD(P)-binding domain-containing protein [Mollisia scopiformis]|uniref:FAD/NAD(P)-binding domain-containing protein n=1 Tax=Mollisia scopiformis TaxID=149040 RepID=A0A194XNC5_MOLSC|nr:FAD/NAD(P)-binding domain-containing protein [Mollisia scopiformis]KUJ21599.1 FAD/NAD(P)-binding domain-containing protein [Mollisia scopiformis]